MFGIGIFEIVIILIVAVIFLGPDKLPKAIIDAVKFFKAVKRTIDETKQTLDKEINISHLKQEALEYKHNFEHNIEQITKDIQLQEINDMFEEYKQLPQNLESKTSTSKTAGILESSTKSTAKPKTSTKTTAKSGAKSKTTKPKSTKKDS